MGAIRGIVAAACLYGLAAGVVIALTTPPMSGGTIAGAALVALTGGKLIDMYGRGA